MASYVLEPPHEGAGWIYQVICFGVFIVATGIIILDGYNGITRLAAMYEADDQLQATVELKVNTVFTIVAARKWFYKFRLFNATGKTAAYGKYTEEIINAKSFKEIYYDLLWSIAGLILSLGTMAAFALLIKTVGGSFSFKETMFKAAVAN